MRVNTQICLLLLLLCCCVYVAKLFSIKHASGLEGGAGAGRKGGGRGGANKLPRVHHACTNNTYVCMVLHYTIHKTTCQRRITSLTTLKWANAIFGKFIEYIYHTCFLSSIVGACNKFGRYGLMANGLGGLANRARMYLRLQVQRHIRFIS